MSLPGGAVLQRIQSALGVSSEEAARLLALTVPTVNVFDLEPIEYNEGNVRRPAVGTQTIAAGGAGNESGIMIRNPTGSGVIVKITQFRITVSGADALSIRLAETNANLTTVSTNVGFRDTRQPGAPSAIISGVAQAGAFGGTALSQYSAATANQTEILDETWYLGETRALILAMATDNLALTAAFQWEEVTASIAFP